jgi:hypothetical protein
MNSNFKDYFLTIIRSEPERTQKIKRISLQKKIITTFFESKLIPNEIKEKNEVLFEPYLGEIEGSGVKKEDKKRIVLGGSYLSSKIQTPQIDNYIPLGKYLAHKSKLIGGKLQIRSHNNNQVHNLKSQNITNNVRDILMKLNKNETINFKDVDKLNTDEKNQLYILGKKLHITELFDIPSTLKSQEDILKDEFIKLRGSIVSGNNSPDLLRKFKIVMLKMKNNKLISLQEYNEVLNILFEMEI